MEFYDASSAAPQDPIEQVLGDLGADATTSALLERLHEVDDLVDRILEEEGAQPLDADIVAALEQITGAQDAPDHFRRVYERVERRATTWDRFWQRPHDEYRGFEIIQAAIVRTTRETGETLARLDTKEQRD
ncbi:hypothetical protein [Nocardioides sp. zg-1228]|uniref:hypothetical protein n=1 Tax=Nocardioides sp. zg-1228 TaxID=2763008 RepID=UPI001642714D|nr:hypothetical protein [Nocardioides sp. zg-1228]MBC2934812.1 hypothetical protein [Nocardioides sp. zg-1228]QSF58397.1 hypothetical protein JX575_04105 [Nocardioides sp. zg-1228]